MKVICFLVNLCLGLSTMGLTAACIYSSLNKMDWVGLGFILVIMVIIDVITLYYTYEAIGE